jgi:lipopolysaccharide/colanic/teichoic acid biosynthesis glycosyltransferase
VYSVERRLLYDAVKRGLDISVAALTLIAGAPLWLATAVAIRLSSPGPAIFYRTVIGRRGRPFRFYKFRTMRHGADDAIHVDWVRGFVQADAPFKLVGARAVYKVFDDSRVTGLGVWLRRFSIDEIPQLVNVLRGDMSLVGPRPPIVEEFELYDERAKRRLSVLPGITGLYQIKARGAVPFSEMLRIDLDYINRRSLWLDLRVFARTPGVMLHGRGSGHERKTAMRDAADSPAD